MSWENIIKNRPTVVTRGGLTTVEGFETKVDILKWETEDGERKGTAIVTWGWQMGIRDDYIREMDAGVNSIKFEDGTVVDANDFDDGIHTDMGGKPFGSGRFHPMNIYFDKTDSEPLVSFEFY
jgi:hypothetical protein